MSRVQILWPCAGIFGCLKHTLVCSSHKVTISSSGQWRIWPKVTRDIIRDFLIWTKMVKRQPIFGKYIKTKQIVYSEKRNTSKGDQRRHCTLAECARGLVLSVFWQMEREFLAIDTRSLHSVAVDTFPCCQNCVKTLLIHPLNVVKCYQRHTRDLG